MPFITLYLPRGCDDGALETSMRGDHGGRCRLLENTLERMIRVTVLEADLERVPRAGLRRKPLPPTVLFRVGPGRSAGAKDAFMDQIASILSRNLGCAKEDVRAYVLDNEEGHHFCIGGLKAQKTLKKVK